MYSAIFYRTTERGKSSSIQKEKDRTIVLKETTSKL